jgi:alpha-L-arabinofuranosidase
MMARVRVHTGQPIGRVDPNIYGQFIEHLGRCIYGGLWAEMLTNRKFSGPDLKEFGVVSPWVSVNKGENVRFSHDNTTYYTGKQSQRVRVLADDGLLHGVAQGPLLVRCGQRFHLRLVTRQAGLTGPLHFALESERGDRVYAKAEFTCQEGGWHTHEATLTAAGDDPQARLALTFHGVGTVWFGAASLMPEESRAGWRPDVVEAAQGLHPALVRWPGGNFVSAYHWRDGIGPVDRRPTRVDPVWAALEPNDVGTDEFMALCRHLGTEPYLCVNIGSGTAEEAAGWVEYCNGPADSPMGALRAANGHPEPYGVRYWGVGNETFGNWQHGHVDAETYAYRCVACARAMRAVDPTVRLVGVGAHEYEAPGWNDTVLELAGQEIDYLSVHHYTPGEVPRDRTPSHDELYPVIAAGPEQVEDLILQAQEAIDRHGLTDRVHLALDEWNVWVYAHYECGMEEPYLLRDGLYAASVFNVMYRHAGQVTLANLAQMVNVLGAIYTTPSGLFLTPIYLANQLQAEHSGAVSVQADVESPAFSAPAMGFNPERPVASWLDAAATVDECGKQLYVSLVNRHRQEALDVEIEVEGAGVRVEGAGHMLNGPSALSGNSITNPDVVRIEPVAPFRAGQRFIYTCPAHTATVLELRLEKAA